MDWRDFLKFLLSGVQIKAWQLRLETPEVQATTPMLRGVWGRALRHLDEKAYRRVFTGDPLGHRRILRYILRPAPPDPATAPAIEWILLGVEEHLEDVLWRAWDVAAGMGLGPQRVPFRIRARLPLGADCWNLAAADWPLPGCPATTPCRLHFPTSVRLLRRGHLLTAPNAEDLAKAAVRRIAGLAGITGGADYSYLIQAVSQQAAGLEAALWRGQRLDFVRWSASQQRELNMHGVAGDLSLPTGLGPLWPLFAAACWTHIGKGTIFGLGQLHITKNGE